MCNLINRQTLYEKVSEAESLARQRVIDTPSSLPNGSLNPAYIKYMTQLSERTKFKEMIYDESSVGRKKGKLLNANPFGECSICGYLIDYRDRFNYCPNCGADVREREEE